MSCARACCDCASCLATRAARSRSFVTLSLGASNLMLSSFFTNSFSPRSSISLTRVPGAKRLRRNRFSRLRAPLNKAYLRVRDGAVRVEVEVAARARRLELLSLGELVRQVLAERL